MARHLLVGLAAVILALPATAFALPTASPSVQEQVDAALAAVPGGVQTSATTVSWERGTVTLTVAPAKSVGSCVTGSFCAFSGTNLTGSKLTFTSCTVHSTAALSGGVHSIANATALGTVYGETSSGTVLSIVLPGGQQNSSPAGIAQLDCL